MGDLDRIVNISISRQTATVPRASFGIPGIIAEFATTKTTVAFTRAREYATLTEMDTDGWGVSDPVYNAAQKIFSQNPTVEKVIVGRKDSGDASFAAALGAIRAENDNWYCFGYVDGMTNTSIFAADFVTGNSIVATINGTAVTAVPFNVDMQTTMGDLETQIEADITGSSVTVSGSPFRTLTITIVNDGANERVTASYVITGGASQTTYTSTEATLIVDQDRKDIAAWVETQKKLYAWSSSAADIKNSAVSSDIASFMESQNYDRTFGMYYKDSDITFIEFGWMGETLPFDPGTQTWAYKTLAGVASYTLLSGEITAVHDKNCGTYLEVGGNDVTEEGKVASGEWIDIMRGLDWIESEMQANVFTELLNVRKIPYTDAGVLVMTGTVQSTLNNASTEDNPILVRESIVVTAPLVASVAAVDKQNRLLPDIDFTATLQGAIHKTTIAGIVTV